MRLMPRDCTLRRAICSLVLKLVGEMEEAFRELAEVGAEARHTHLGREGRAACHSEGGEQAAALVRTALKDYTLPLRMKGYTPHCDCSSSETVSVSAAGMVKESYASR